MIQVQNKIIGQYTYIKEIGEGSFGKVYLAIDQHQKEVVIKEIQQPKTPKQKEYIESEKTILKTTEHPNIVKMIEDFELDKKTYLIFEYCSEGDLEQYLLMKTDYFSQQSVNSQYRFNQQQARFLFRQILAAFVYLQGKMIIHRDLKLANILLTADLTVKIADFGFSKQFDHEDDITYSFCGTPASMPPEQLNKAGPYGLNCNVFQLGVALYYMIYGAWPHNTLMKEPRIYFREDKPVFLNLEDVYENVNDLIKGMIENDPSKRVTLQQVQEHHWVKNDKDDHLLSYKQLFPEKTKCQTIQSQIVETICSTFQARTEIYSLCKEALTLQIQPQELIVKFMEELQTMSFQITTSFANGPKNVSFVKCHVKDKYEFIDFNVSTYKFINALYRQFLSQQGLLRANQLLQFILKIWDAFQRTILQSNSLNINYESNEDKEILIKAIEKNKRFLNIFQKNIIKANQQEKLIQRPIDGLNLEWRKCNHSQTYQKHMEQLTIMLEFRKSFFL